MSHCKLWGLHRLCRKLHIPEGNESLLLIGMIGGYPVGAKMVADSYSRGSISQADAHILLGYCSNAGPAFILGITPILFHNPLIPWLLWIIHIVSALITGVLLPKPGKQSVRTVSTVPISFNNAVHSSIQICSRICGWIILFKVLLTLITAMIPGSSNTLPVMLLSGILELSNGCTSLLKLDSETLRYILCSAFLALGGTCVAMQTVSAVSDLGIGLYIPGKIMQCMISIILSVLSSNSIFRANNVSYQLVVALTTVPLLIITGMSLGIKKLWKLRLQ